MANRKRIVLTGGPCAGKSTIAQVLEKAFQNKLVVLPESASLLFSGGFPRWKEPICLKGLQGAIFHTQRGLEENFAGHHPEKMLIMDRGTVDGAAYWPEGADAFWAAMGTTLEAELARYDLVIYLESAGRDAYEENARRNPSRTETWDQAEKLDKITFERWQSHSRLIHIKNNTSFSAKISSVLSIIEEEIR